MKYKNFKNYVLHRIEKNYSQFYETYEDFVAHCESGEVTLPLTYAIQLQADFVAQFPEITIVDSKTEAINTAKPLNQPTATEKVKETTPTPVSKWLEKTQLDFEKRYKENLQKQQNNLQKYINDRVTGKTTGNGLLDMLTASY